MPLPSDWQARLDALDQAKTAKPQPQAPTSLPSDWQARLNQIDATRGNAAGNIPEQQGTLGKIGNFAADVYKSTVRPFATPFAGFAAGVTGHDVQLPGWLGDAKGSVDPSKQARIAGGAALEAAALLPAGKGIKSLGATSPFLSKVATEAALGARAGALGSAGYTLSTNEDATTGDVLKSGIQGGLYGGVIGASAGAISSVKVLPSKESRIIEKRVSELSKLEENNASVRKAIQASKAKGIDAKGILAQTDLLHGAVDDTGTIRTTQDGGAVSQLQDFIKPQESVVSKVLAEEGKTIPLDELKSRMVQSVNDSGVKGGAKVRALRSVDEDIAGYALEADKNGNLPLSVVQDAKIDKYRNINYLNPEASRVDKAVAKALKQTVEEKTTSADVKALNDELSRHYSVLSLLEKMDGKKVSGGKLGKYFAQTIGSIVGSHFGPLGTLAGAEIGSRIKGGAMARTFSGKTGRVLEQSDVMKKALAPKPKLPLIKK